MTKIERIAFPVIGVLTILAFVFWKDVQSLAINKTSIASVTGGGDKKKDKKNKENNISKRDSTITIQKKWEMPTVLNEISGIASITDNKFACVQDESGTIFIFNTTDGNIEKEIPFAGPGDYEGIAVVAQTAYIVRADGKIFEVKNYNANNRTVSEYSTPLTVKQNVEGLCYDQKNNRLLLAIKGNEPNTKDYKGIYAFDLATKKLAAKPAFKIDLTNNIWDGVKGKDKMQPSDLDVHPSTGDIYIVDGANPKLLVMGSDGSKKHLYQLSSDDFAQPEGIAFTKSGELFISNESRKASGNILKVSVRN